MDTLRVLLCNAACTLLLANSVDKRYVKESKRTWTELYSVVTSTKRTREPLASKCRCNAICLREQFNLSSAKPALASSFNNSIQRGADLTGVQIVETSRTIEQQIGTMERANNSKRAWRWLLGARVICVSVRLSNTNDLGGTRVACGRKTSPPRMERANATKLTINLPRRWR